jgi:hypothetical protein
VTFTCVYNVSQLGFTPSSVFPHPLFTPFLDQFQQVSLIHFHMHIQSTLTIFILLNAVSPAPYTGTLSQTGPVLPS